jgi:histidine triad (HIT) family protein
MRERAGVRVESMTTCPFCAIARGEGDAHLVFEDAAALAFLDRRPVFYGHCLLIPRLHCATLADLPAALLQPFFADVQLLSRAVERAMAAEGSFVGINNRVSQSVPHLHVHVIPRTQGDGLRGFFWPRLHYRDDRHLLQVRDALRDAASELAVLPSSHPLG